MDRYNIYLAGGMMKFNKERFSEQNSWRTYCKKILEEFQCDYKVKVTNPNDYFSFKDDPPAYQSQREIMEFDLDRVRNADLLIVNFNDITSLGTMSELTVAYEKRIPVIGINVGNQKLHPWQVEMANRIFGSLDEALCYVENFYLT